MQPIIGVPILLVNRNSDAKCTENIGMSIGKRVKQARKHAGLTQIELGKKVGMTQSTVSELETGESASTTSTATIANALGVSAYWLETGLGEMRPQEPVDPVRVDGWSELTRVDRVELRLLALYREADDRTKRDMQNSMETYAKSARERTARLTEDPVERDRLEQARASKTTPLPSSGVTVVILDKKRPK